jgi:hypothetical protein
VDFRKAYDTVSHEALWLVAQHAGVPSSLVTLLRKWNTGRTSALEVNGVSTAPFDILRGVPQGDVLSPWLFNLYIESLLRTLQADAQYTGVDAFGISVKELVYADDLALLCTSRAQAQRALTIVHNWCERWGMRMNVGQRKTEAMVFQPASAAAAPLHEDVNTPLAVGDLVVPITDTYKYLGMTMNADLMFEPLIERYAEDMATNFNRYFRYNSVMRRHTLRSQLIKLRTFVLSAGTFLASALPAHRPAASEPIDREIESMLRSMLRLPGSEPIKGAVWQASKLPMTLGVWVRERVRIYLEALSPDTHNPRGPASCCTGSSCDSRPRPSRRLRARGSPTRS